MRTYLLDANVLIALSVFEHERHDRAARWLSTTVRAFHEHPRSEFWSDSLSYRDVDLERLPGHRQVTDNYLTALAGHRKGVLATFDEPLAARSPGTAYLVR